MHIEGLGRGSSVAPLTALRVIDFPEGRLEVEDGAGRVVATTPEFLAGGFPGIHRVRVYGPDRGVLAETRFRMQAETRIRDGRREAEELLRQCLYTCQRFSEGQSVLWNGRLYRFFVCWLRDHVHVLKGMKYFSADLKSAIELYRDSQREDGMVWDNVYFRDAHPNIWDTRFRDGGFIRPFDDWSAEFKRIPVENDVEYLFVEGLYVTWKATGDDAWMAAGLDAAMRALDYSVTDTRYRFSEKLGLLKRGYTIDTWDFQATEDCVCDGDIMRVDPDRTRFGAMFGDNTGYMAGCRQLAEMLEVAGRAEEAATYRERAYRIQARLDELCWAGGHFRHHVPEEVGLVRDLGVDEEKQVSLSNAYSLNRGIRAEQAAAILATYRNLKENLPPGSPGEWYQIFPPFERGFGHSNQKWQYMNGGVTTIVAGELARGAFVHGEEGYGADILQRLRELGRAHGNRFHEAYTGAIEPRPEAVFTPVDLAPFANIDTHGDGAEGVPGWTGEGNNDLRSFPAGRQTFCGIPFEAVDPVANGRRAAIGLRKRPGYADEIRIPIGRAAPGLYWVHLVSGAPRGIAGTLEVRYADGTTHREYVVSGQNVTGWWIPDRPSGRGTRTLDIAWRGESEVAPHVAASLYAMDHAHPDKEIAEIVLRAAEDGAFWAVLGLTLSDHPAYLEPDPLSYGIPENWGAAAVVYALVEGLAGVVDSDRAFERAEVSPRWASAGESEAEVCVYYPASDGYVAYHYRFEDGALRVTVTGSGESARLRVLLPEGFATTSCTVDGVRGPAKIVGGYVETDVALGRVTEVEWR